MCNTCSKWRERHNAKIRAKAFYMCYPSRETGACSDQKVADVIVPNTRSQSNQVTSGSLQNN